MKKYIFATDLHFGWERKHGHKVPLHDAKALRAMLAFAKDFKPDVFILGGDTLDCSVVSHHNHGKPGATEGLKLIEDAKEGRKAIIDPIERLMGPKGKLIYIIGNHEDWLTDLTDKIPALEGLLNVRTLLHLSDRWKIVPNGEAYSLGKVTFIHGDQLSGGEHVAKAAVISYERNVRFGHFHCFQTYCKSSAVDYKNGKTGIAVPCLCGKNPAYTAGSPNRWMQGFLYGYSEDNGNFSDSVVVILDGKCIVGGKIYRG